MHHGSHRGSLRRTCEKTTTYLVPIDFSTVPKLLSGMPAKIARENRGKLVFLHVINWKAVLAPRFPRNYVEILKNKARDGLKKLARRMRLEPGEYRSILIWGEDTARAIADQAKKLKASMIIMESHGRTGLKRLMLGSVAK